MKDPLYIQELSPLFEAVQQAIIFEDQKTMADAVPKFSTIDIMYKFNTLERYTKEELKTFVLTNFDIKPAIEPTDFVSEFQLPIEEHIEKLWDELTRTSAHYKGTLLTLPYPYIVPGGRFDEFFYWDSYYIMLGLQTSGRIEMMRHIVDNCSYLILRYGFVPNGNRTYFLSRSQPPYFSLMLDLLYESTKDEKIYTQYYKTLEREYQFWMDGMENLGINSSYKRVIKTVKGDILNRYYDDENIPRPESYMIDLADYGKAENQDFYRNVRAACESGWDFSSRWFRNQESISSIHTLDLAQIDLNCLLWHLEHSLEKVTQRLNLAEQNKIYLDRAKCRKEAIQKYFWHEEIGLYTDYLFKEDRRSTSQNAASLYPLFLGIAPKEKAQRVAENIAQKFLKNGGIITTTIESGQQWDSPNAWAPYQWLGYVAMQNYDMLELAEKIKNNWCTNVERIYRNSSKLMEKYNAIDTQSIAGGGEYPNQDGFGWTNGVYIKLKQL